MHLAVRSQQFYTQSLVALKRQEAANCGPVLQKGMKHDTQTPKLQSLRVQHACPRQTAI